ASALYDLFRDPSVRLLLVSCLVLQMSQQLCGINAVFYYSTMFFNGIISNPLTGTILVATVNVIATYVALKVRPSSLPSSFPSSFPPSLFSNRKEI
ncbi:sugar transporter, partial [Nannochloropsis oceanica]